jgi:soluble lytic murein transglycosylase-like protein
MRGQGWLNWSLGFLAGAALASWLTLSCATSGAQSPEVAAALSSAAQTYGVSEGWMRRITWCESRWQPWVTSRGGHMGIAQFSTRTWNWMSAQAGWGGYSAYDAWAALHTLAWALSRGYSGHWSCR